MPSQLLVYVPGLTSKPTHYQPLLTRLQAELGPDWQVRVWQHGLTPFSKVRLEDLAADLSAQIRSWAGLSGAPSDVERIVLVGHSIGGVIARFAYLIDAGAVPVRTFGPPSWSPMVGRIALLAAPNAGFRTARLTLPGRVAFPLLAPLGKWTAEQACSGSAFITELRLRWVDHFRGPGPHPEVVQLLGGGDKLVTEEDSLDVVYMQGAVSVPVPDADHAGLIDVSGDKGEERFQIIKRAIADEIEGTKLPATPIGNRTGYFLLHGIRSSNYSGWVDQLAAAIKREDPQAYIYPPSYGYFSALEFALPPLRRRKVRRFLDMYSRFYVSHHPEQLFFAGHSYGTYLAGHALKQVPAVTFKRVFLAGSVLPRAYPWELVTGRGQVLDLVRNDQATKDIPVGLLCSLLRGLGSRDVGTAGVNGFDQVVAQTSRYPGAFDGGHGAALTGPERVKDVAQFLTRGECLSPATDAAPSWFLRAGRVAQAAPAFAGAAGGVVLAAQLCRADLSAKRIGQIGAAAALLAVLKAL